MPRPPTDSLAAIQSARTALAMPIVEAPAAGPVAWLCRKIPAGASYRSTHDRYPSERRT